MADKKNSKSGEKSSQTQDKAQETKKKDKKSNEVTEREKVQDPGHVHRIEEKTEKH